MCTPKENLIAEPKITEVPYHEILRNQLGDDAIESCCAFSGKQIKDKMNNETHNFIANIKIPDDGYYSTVGLSSKLRSNNIILKSIEPLKEHKYDGYDEDDYKNVKGIFQLLCCEYKGDDVIRFINNEKKCYVTNMIIHDDAQCYLDTKSEKIYCDKYTLDSIEPIKKRHYSLPNDAYQYIRIA
jgi:hypothetical protein